MVFSTTLAKGHLRQDTCFLNPELSKETTIDIPGYTFPEVSTESLDILGISDILNLIPGWGLFNFGTDVDKIIFTLRNKKG